LESVDESKGAALVGASFPRGTRFELPSMGKIAAKVISLCGEEVLKE